ncbi:phosphatase PAP2 family protein [Candidatus Saccharibacteria bacterium]|jgi:membrane-associated phospholipid phosphatase|nr:phosphatase PAP2 family protein [Candidatus Saccharibacteria bacterium]
MIYKNNYNGAKDRLSKPPAGLLGLLIGLPILIFIILAIFVQLERTIFIDAPVINAIQSLSSASVTVLMKLLTHAGDKILVGITAVAIAGGLFIRHRQKDALMVLVTIGGSAALNIIFKLIFARPRPTPALALIVEDGFSFPSGHAMAAAVLAVIVILLIRHSRWRIAVSCAAVGYMIIVGISRIYLGVHYPSDILAGFCVSIAWAVVVYSIFQYTSLYTKITSKIPFLAK